MNLGIPWEQIDSQKREKITRAIAGTPPQSLIYPSSQADLAAIVTSAQLNHTPLLPCGNGTKIDWGGLVHNPQLLVSTAKLNQIVEHAVGDLTVTVEAGVTLQQLQNFLQPFGQFLPLDPAYPENATLGGIVATADAGSWRQRYGGVRDMVLGLSFIRADGEIAKAGGRVVKNVAGYDTMKLFTGSYGTLGIISQITFRLYPLPEASQTLGITGEAIALNTLCQTLRSSGLTPTAAEILAPALVKTLNLGSKLGLILRFQSIPRSISQQVQQVQQLAHTQGCETSLYQDAQETTLWQQLLETIIIPRDSGAITAKIGILPTQINQFLQRLERITQGTGFAMVNLSSGVGRLQLNKKDSLVELRSWCESYQGYLTILEAPKEVKKEIEPWGYRGNARAIMKTLKDKFDPQHIFSPSRFI